MGTKATGLPEENRDELLMQLKNMRKAWATRKTIGKRMNIPRDGKDPVSVLLYRPKEEKNGNHLLPVLFNMHGGAWVGGDAVLMESFCQMMADSIPAIVVNINYTKADVQKMPYQQEEIEDVVSYFAQHPEEYGILPEKFAIGGHSAGAHLSCGVAYKMAQEGFHFAAQMLVYPVADLSKNTGLAKVMKPLLFPEGGEASYVISPATAPEKQLRKVAPAIFVVCGKDDLLSEGLEYAAHLVDAGVEVHIKKYPQAEHGFLEVNRSDYPDGDPRQNKEQAAYARDCEAYLVRELKSLLQ